MQAVAVLAALASACATVELPGGDIGQAASGIELPIARSVFLRDSGCSAVAVGQNRLVTAKHCAPDDAKAGDAYEGGTLLHVSPTYDFVVFECPDRRLPILLRKPLVGEHLYVVGFPVQLGSGEQELTVTDGIVAGPTNSDGEARITAPIYFGNSGGGVWGDDGALLGIAVSIYAYTPLLGSRPVPYVGQGFMVPANLVQPWL